LYRSLDSPDVTYIAFDLANASLWITQAFCKDWHQRAQFARKHLTREQVATQTAFAREAIANKLRAVKTGTAILSAESISRLKRDEICDLVDSVRSHAHEIRAIGYIRAPKSYAESVFQERLKHIPTSFTESMIRVKYKKLIQALDDALGQENVEIGKFDRATLTGGCVVKDFCRKVGISLRDEDISTSNESLSLPAVQLLYLLWKYHPKFYRPRAPRLHALLLRLVGRSGGHVDHRIIAHLIEHLSQFPGPKMHFHADAYRKVVSVDEAELEWLRQRTGISFAEDIHAHDDIGIRDEGDLMTPDEQTVRRLLDKLTLNVEDAPYLMADPELLARHVRLLACGQ
jgi:hypothetical protein